MSSLRDWKKNGVEWKVEWKDHERRKGSIRTGREVEKTRRNDRAERWKRQDGIEVIILSAVILLFRRTEVLNKEIYSAVRTRTSIIVVHRLFS